MDIKEALEIVIDLAEQNVIDFDYEDDDLNEQRQKQTAAIEKVRATLL